MGTSLAMSPAPSKDAPGGLSHASPSIDIHTLRKNMDDFNCSLERWTHIVEDQVHLLTDSFQQLADIGRSEAFRSGIETGHAHNTMPSGWIDRTVDQTDRLSILRSASP